MGKIDHPRILVLEDELLIAMELAALIERGLNIVVGPASSCREALDLIATLKIDAAILDLQVRDEDCSPVANELEARKIPWALCTGFSVSDLDARFKSVPLISKPFRQGEIERTIRQMLRQV